MAEFVASQPTGAWGRRSWFLFEWLTGQRLPLPDAKTGNYVELWILPSMSRPLR